MPALRHFHDGIHDDDHRASIIATAVILRQLEDIDDAEDDPALSGSQVNFLAIINAVTRSLPSQNIPGQTNLTRAAFWTGVRQEIYHAFTRGQQSQMSLIESHWHGASLANQIVLHTVQVASWRWGEGGGDQWHRLIAQQARLESDILRVYTRIYRRVAEKSKGEMFPVIWFSNAIEITSWQHVLLAKVVLVAEEPPLKMRDETDVSAHQL